MTSQEYEQKKRECWKRYKRDNWESLANVQDAFNYAFDRAYKLGKQFGNSEQLNAEDTVIQGWVARASDGNLALFKRKPDREIYRRSNNGLWFGGSMSELDANLYPDLTWDDDPQPVEIIIKRKKNE